MERPRFSGKELLKHVKTETVIPRDYVELKDAVEMHSTEKAYLLLLDNLEEKWLPKNFVIIKDNKYYCASWLIKKD